MKTVGVRELKNRLSEYLREVRLGTTVLVTDRGTVVAELRQPELRTSPVTRSTLLDRWIEVGMVREPLSAKIPVPSTGARLADGTSAALLDAERGA
jgi:hypothetical protein